MTNWRYYAGLAAILVVAVVFMLSAFAYARHSCERAGGHPVAVYKGTICVSDDGRVIEP